MNDRKLLTFPYCVLSYTIHHCRTCIFQNHFHNYHLLSTELDTRVFWHQLQPWYLWELHNLDLWFHWMSNLLAHNLGELLGLAKIWLIIFIIWELNKMMHLLSLLKLFGFLRPTFFVMKRKVRVYLTMTDFFWLVTNVHSRPDDLNISIV